VRSGALKHGPPDIAAKQNEHLFTVRVLIFVKTRFYQAAQVTAPLHAVASTTTPNAIRYQANGTKLWVAM